MEEPRAWGVWRMQALKSSPVPVILEDACRRETRVLTKGMTTEIVDGHSKSTPVGKATLRIHKDTEEDLRARGRLLARESPQTV